jgi:excisionase family DNA binding protein
MNKMAAYNSRSGPAALSRPHDEVVEIMTLAEIAEYLRLGRRTIYRLVQDGAIPAHKVAGQWRFLRDEIQTWLRTPDRRLRSGSAASSERRSEQPKARVEDIDTNEGRSQ